MGVGIILFVIGLIGLMIKVERYSVKRNSYTGHPLRWGPYVMILVGIVLMVYHGIEMA